MDFYYGRMMILFMFLFACLHVSIYLLIYLFMCIYIYTLNMSVPYLYISCKEKREKRREGMIDMSPNFDFSERKIEN